MILRRRFLHKLSNQIPKTVNAEFPARHRFILTPRIVDSTLSGCPSDIISLSFFLWCARQPDFFHEPQSFDRMVPVVGRLTDKFETVKGVVRGMESFGCVRKAQTFLILLRIYWRGGMYALALEAFHQMTNYGYTPNTFARNIIIDVLFKVGLVDAALEVLKGTQNPNFLTFNIAVCNLCRLNNLSGVRDVLRVMVREGFKPNSGSFLMILNCFCKGRRLLESLQVLGLMIILGIQLSVNMWSVLIDGFCRIGKLGVANQLLEKMVGSGCSPNIVIYTSLIKGFIEAQMFDEAIRVLNNMESQGCIPDLVLYNVQISLLSKLGRYDDALDVFLTLPERNLEPDSYSLSSILSTLCLSHGYALLPYVFLAFPKRNLESDSYNLCSVFSTTSCLSYRYALLPQLISELVVPFDRVVYNCLLLCLSKAGFHSLVVYFYTDMLDKGFAPDGYSYVGLLHGLCRAGMFDEAINAYNGIVMSNYCLDAHIHTVIVCELIKVGNFHRASRLFRKAVFDNFPLDVVSYTVAIHCFLKGGRIGEAHSIYCQMKEVGLIPNTVTCNVMLLGLRKAREVKLMEWLLKDMVDMGIKDGMTFSNIVFLLKSGRIRSAIQLYIEMQEFGLKPSNATYAQVDHLAWAKEVDKASYSLLKDYSEVVLFVDNTRSDDLPDVVASAG